jgi:hypothetical protein
MEDLIFDVECMVLETEPLTPAETGEINALGYTSADYISDEGFIESTFIF